MSTEATPLTAEEERTLREWAELDGLAVKFTSAEARRFLATLTRERAEHAALREVAEIMRRHTHWNLTAMTYHAGPTPEQDCLLCRALVAAGVLTLAEIGSGTRAAIKAERAALDEVKG